MLREKEEVESCKNLSKQTLCNVLIIISKYVQSGQCDTPHGFYTCDTLDISLPWVTGHQIHHRRPFHNHFNKVCGWWVGG
jgi:hypothetical protein